ncbi:MAG: 2-dehydropantoate 2-reductase [Ideonella sp.]|nr:2-dehydropantoate 2-reductase [Ideonella sp.]MCC7455472.1 2-dehydropantoate 2-reductase [Nitrospira sp.]
MDGKPWQHTVVVGAGAVGSYFGAMLARAGHRVTLIGRAAHVEAIGRHGLQLHKGGRVESVRLGATTGLTAVRDADLVLLCVKSTDTAALASPLASLLRPDAWVMSLQNGVENAPLLAAQLRQPVLPTAVYVAVEMPQPGAVVHHGRGDLLTGPLDAAAAQRAGFAARLQALVALFAAAEVPVTLSPDVMAELWRKLMVNCAYNAVSGLAQLPYGALAAVPGVLELQRAVVHEVVAVARAEGVALDLDASLQTMAQLAAAMPAQRSSTAQDMARGKPSEIDHLNGTVLRRGAAHGIATPVNQALHALVKLVEAGHPGGWRAGDAVAR